MGSVSIKDRGVKPDKTEMEYIYSIADKEIKKVAQSIIRDVGNIYFKEKEWDKLEEPNESNNIACLFLFQIGTSGSSRSEDIIKARRVKHPKVTCIIIVCICKENGDDHSEHCSEKLSFEADKDRVFKYHIKGDGRPHGCSSDVVKEIQSYVHMIAPDDKPSSPRIDSVTKTEVQQQKEDDKRIEEGLKLEKMPPNKSLGGPEWKIHGFQRHEAEPVSEKQRNLLDPDNEKIEMKKTIEKLQQEIRILNAERKYASNSGVPVKYSEDTSEMTFEEAFVQLSVENLQQRAEIRKLSAKLQHMEKQHH